MSTERGTLDVPASSPVPGAQRLWPMLLGWVVAPLLVLCGVVALGVHLGASHPDAWYTELVRWLTDFLR